MELRLTWHKFWLRDGRKVGLPYTTTIAKIPAKHGIYIFGRRWAQDFEALYVGKANKLRTRINTQLNNARLMNHVKRTSTGRRIVYVGVFKAGPAQQWKRCGPIIEKGLIRFFISEDHRLANKQGTRIQVHEIVSDGDFLRRVWGSEIAVER